MDKNGDDSQIIVTSLQTLTGRWDRAVFFKHLTLEYLVVDEAHNLKNANSQLYTRMRKKIASKRYLLMTGSPIQNRLTELRNLLLFIVPARITSEHLSSALDIFVQGKGSNTKHEADMKVKLPGGADMKNEVEFLSSVLAPLILRRRKDEVLNELPHKTVIIEKCQMEDRQLEMYQTELLHMPSSTLRDELIQMMERTYGKTEFLESSGGHDPHSRQAGTTFIQNIVARLRRVCNHPALNKVSLGDTQFETIVDYFHTSVLEYGGYSRTKIVDIVNQWSDFDLHREAEDHLPQLGFVRLTPENMLEGCKIRKMIQIVRNLRDSEEKALIFSQFTLYLDVIEEAFQTHLPDVVYARLDGNTSISERQDLVDAFQQDAEIRVFLLSTKAGGFGLNLTAANRVILLDQDWNPHNDRQAEDRAHRLGQTKDVVVHKICCEGSIEEVILQCCDKKIDLDVAFGGTSNSVRKFVKKGEACHKIEPGAPVSETTSANDTDSTLPASEMVFDPATRLPDD